MILLSFWHKVGLKAIGSQEIHPTPKELLAFCRSEFAYRGKHIGMLGCNPFERLLGHHVEFPSLCLWIDVRQL